MQLYNDINEIVSESVYEPFKHHVLTMMGDGLVSVELEDEQIVAAFYRAREIFRERTASPYKRAFMALQIENGKREYDLPDNVETVVNIIQSRSGFNTEDPFHVSVINDWFGFGPVGGQRDLLVYDLTTQQIEQLKKYSSFYRQWIHKYYEGKLELLKEPYADETWFLEVHTFYTNEELMNMTWIQRYTIAEGKHILGRAYKKFGGQLEGPFGSTQLDGDSLVQEGQEEKEQLITDLNNFVHDGAPTGWPIVMG